MLTATFALLVIVPAARLAGRLAEAIGQPRVIGEIVGGLVLGALVTRIDPGGAVAGSFQSVTPALSTLANLGVVLMLFQLGMEFDFGHLRQPTHRRTVAAVSAVGFLVPFATGFSMRLLHAPALHGTWTLPSALFCGVAFAVTALPVLGRILVETRLGGTAIGAVAIACAAVQDLVAWVALGALAALHASQEAGGAGTLATLGGMAVFLAFVFGVVRPAARRWLHASEAGGDADLLRGHGTLAWMLVAVLAASAATSLLGLHGALGAFALGVALHDRHDLRDAWIRGTSPLVYTLLVPVFFVLTGARIDFGEVGSGSLAWGAAWLVAACAAKVLGSFAGARMAGVPRPDALRLSVLLNTRGLTELVVLNMGLDLGLLSPALFSVLVVMALVSTVATVPLVRWLQRRTAKSGEAAAGMGWMH